ncbi:MAG: DoxX family protein [Pseudomonadota bacterium]
MTYVILGIKVLLTLAFVGAGASKLLGVEMMVATFETIGLGQWFRYVTGIIEVVGAALLWVKGREAIGAGLLVCTMIGAIIAHFVILGPSALQSALLGVLSAVVLWNHRTQLTG